MIELLLLLCEAGHTLELLLERLPADRLAGLSRTPERAADLAERGIEIRPGDYFDHPSLVRAFDGVDRLLLVSAQAFTDRDAQHFNAITAARQAGVRHVIYTAIQRDEDLGITQVGVTESDVFAEQALRASGLTYTILRNPMYLDQIDVYLGADPYRDGLRVPHGEGTMAPALIRDLAAANVAVLTEDGHENTIYTLTGSEAASFRDLAAALSDLHGETVPYRPVAEEEYLASLQRDLPQPVAEFLTAWLVGVGRGSFSRNTGDLERLIGYRPTSYREFLAKHYPAVTAR
ncbi:NAD(P)H-binding protein [Cryptosporangium phraense]|uniref:NAD(P)H-binding protein n=1 Tax=Cryptosporangium phraense TaxID=2593070 RepID=UPI00197ACF87|nr:NAD(P)H-binding protein [Cryptosporangium phraense]